MSHKRCTLITVFIKACIVLLSFESKSVFPGGVSPPTVLLMHDNHPDHHWTNQTNNHITALGSVSTLPDLIIGHMSCSKQRLNQESDKTATTVTVTRFLLLICVAHSVVFGEVCWVANCNRTLLFGTMTNWNCLVVLFLSLFGCPFHTVCENTMG